MAEEKQVIDEATYATMVFEEGGELTVNLQDVQEQKFEIVPKGTYQAAIDKLEYGMSQSSGNPMFTVDWKITDGEYTGKSIRQFLSFSPKALSGTKAAIMRIAPELVTQPFQPAKLAAEGYFNGKTAKIRVAVGTYEGNERSSVSGIVSAGGEGSGFVN